VALHFPLPPKRGWDPEGRWRQQPRPRFHFRQAEKSGIVTLRKTRVFLFNTLPPSSSNMG